ncbi:MAG: 30S ribosomal protein S3 [bacterium]
MGQKINPIGFRLNINRNWKSTWYAEKKDYGNRVFEDIKIREFIRKKVGHAGIKTIKIERSIGDIRVLVVVLRPGVVIGRGGAGHEMLKEELERLTRVKVDLSVESFKDKDLSAGLVAEDVVSQIKRRMPVRRIIKTTAFRVMGAGAKGVRVQVSGVIGGPSSIARTEHVTLGSVPRQTLRAKIDYARDTAFTGYGTLGVKVWINLQD